MKYQPLLNEYLIQNRILPLAGIGQLVFEMRPAIMKDQDVAIESPQTSIRFSQAVPGDDELAPLVAFISQRTAVPARQVVQELTESADMATLLKENDRLDWPPFGYFQKEREMISFQQAAAFDTYLPSIPTLKKIQPSVSEYSAESTSPNAELEIQETFSESLPETYEPEPPAQKDRWWVWAIIILLLSILLIVVRYAG